MTKRIRLSDQQGHILVEDPPVAKALFSSTKMAWVWLFVRLWIAYQWLNSSLGINYMLGLTSKPGKVVDPAWMSSGEAIRAYWERAVAIPQQGSPPITFDWYREFLKLLIAGNHEVWFSKVIVAGEVMVGLGLLFGALVGVAAFGGGLMNWSFLMAGTSSTNPLLFPLSMLLIMAWKNAGYYGLDRYLLPVLGTPWTQHEAVEKPATAAQPSTPQPATVSNR